MKNIEKDRRRKEKNVQRIKYKQINKKNAEKRREPKNKRRERYESR